VGMGADLTAGDLYKYYDDEEDSDYSHSEDESEGEREDVSEDYPDYSKYANGFTYEDDDLKYM
jgi:hypothetical protein